MAMQREHTELAAERAKDPQLALAGAADGPGVADLLFFPTGGGKTEAYLGLTAYTLGIRRLQGIVGTGGDARDGRAGVAVLMRYTLRLLTAQQFQRAATRICAAEQLRRDAVADQRAGGPVNPWGDEPFRIGLWVGSQVTPNRYDQAKEALEAMRRRYAGASPLRRRRRVQPDPGAVLPLVRPADRARSGRRLRRCPPARAGPGPELLTWRVRS